MNLAELLALIANLATMTDEELTDLRQHLADAAAERADLATEEAAADIEAIADALDKIVGEETSRATAAAERAERVRSAMERVSAATNPASPAPEGDPAAGETPAPEAAAEPVEGERTLEPVAAAGTPAVPIAKVSARRPNLNAPAPKKDTPDPAKWGLVASANVDGFKHGDRLDDPDKIARAFMSTIEATRGWRGGRTQLRVASCYAEFPEERMLGRDTRANKERIEAVTSPRALAAAGGICAPTPVRYDLPTLGSDARPVRDQMLARFGADRGGVTLLPPPQLSDITDGTAVDDWTEANDQNPTDPTTKPCLEVTCPTEEETLVDAITRCLKFGNYRQRYFPEQIEAWLKLLGVRHARHAETKLLTQVGSLSTAVSTGSDLGTTRNVLAQLERVATAWRNRHREPRSTPLRFAAPEWLLANIRTDLLREIPGSAQERLAVTDAEIEAWFRVRNINPTWLMDGESGQVFGAQPDGHALPWPSTVISYLYKEGDFLFLDGGTLDLGIVRDSSLNEVNKVMMFAETFEQVAFHGVEAFRVTIDICPSGATSAPVSFDPCTTGS